MKKGQIVEGIAVRRDFPEKATVLVKTEEGEEKVSVKGALPGQKVSVGLQKRRGGKWEGRLIEVLEKAENEVTPSCEYFGKCGGCSYRGISFTDQLHLKAEQVKRLLSPVLPEETRDALLDSLEIIASPEEDEYRNKMEFSFGDEFKDGPLSLGLHKKGGFYDILNVPGCRIADEDFRLLLFEVQKFFATQEVPYYHRMRHEGVLRHLLVRKAKSSGQILVALVTTGPLNSHPWMDEFKNLILSLPFTGELTGLLHIQNDSVADAVLSDCTTVLYGRDYIEESLLGLQFKISPFSFFQTNTKGAEVLYGKIRDFALEGFKDGEKPVIYDLYSGTGTIGQMMSPAASQVFGIEIVEEAVVAANENAKLNGLTNCTFLAGDVLKMLDEVEVRPDFIILDPPRDGIHPKALTHILNYGVENMIYVSCKPTSLARDLGPIQEAGYRVVKLACVDMFPWTNNIETVVLLSGKKVDGHICIDLNVDRNSKL